MKALNFITNQSLFRRFSIEKKLMKSCFENSNKKINLLLALDGFFKGSI